MRTSLRFAASDETTTGETATGETPLVLHMATRAAAPTSIVDKTQKPGRAGATTEAIDGAARHNIDVTTTTDSAAGRHRGTSIIATTNARNALDTTSGPRRDTKGNGTQAITVNKEGTTRHQRRHHTTCRFGGAKR